MIFFLILSSNEFISYAFHHLIMIVKVRDLLVDLAIEVSTIMFIYGEISKHRPYAITLRHSE